MTKQVGARICDEKQPHRKGTPLMYTIYSATDEMGGSYENGPRLVTEGVTRTEAARRVAADHRHHADCPEANECLIWDGEFVIAEPIR